MKEEKLNKYEHELRVQSNAAFVKYWREHGSPSLEFIKSEIQDVFVQGFMCGVIEACDLMDISEK